MSALSLNAVSIAAPKNSGSSDEAAEERLDPPALQPAVNHEAAEEEPDEQRRLQIEPALERAVACAKPEEDQEPADDQRADSAR